MNTIETAKKRIEMAEQVEQDLMGDRQGEGGLSIRSVDEYLIVDDGMDRWLVRADDYEEAVRKILAEIIDSKRDDLLDDPAELGSAAYDDLCSATSCIYSRIGGPSDLSDITDLEISDELRQEIVEALGVED